MVTEPAQKSLTILSLVNAVVLGGVLTVNTLANTLPINGFNTGQLSDLYPNLFVPAGFTFSIWGLIYLLLIGFVIFQFTKAGVRTREAIGPWWIINGLANMAWIFAWHYRIVTASVLIMLIILVSLFIIFNRLGAISDLSSGEQAFVRIPFSVYFGWITVATIANVTTLLVDIGWAGFGIPESRWAVFMIGVAVLIALNIIYMKADIAYVLVIIWALFGIHVNRGGGFNLIDPVPTFALAGMGVLGLAVIFTAVQKIMGK